MFTRLIRYRLWIIKPGIAGVVLYADRVVRRCALTINGLYSRRRASSVRDRWRLMTGLARFKLNRVVDVDTLARTANDDDEDDDKI